MFRKIAALVLGPAILIGAVSVTQAAADTKAASFVSKANSARQARGLPPYVVKSDLSAVAARHSARMASKNSLYHNPALGSEVSGWQAVGENVGMGGTVDSIHQAFMDSPSHRDNILSRMFTEIGVGTVTDDRGVIWVTQVFRLPQRTATVAPPVAKQASRSVVRVTVRQPVTKPAAKPVAKAPARPARQAVAVRPDSSAFLAALAPAAPAVTLDPLSLALMYADTMSALVL